MNKKNLLLVLMLTLALILRLVNLSFPPQFYFDENYSAFTAVALSRGNAPVIWKPMSQPIDPPRGYEWSHPPLTRILIAASITILGNHPWVWRLTSVLAGVGTTLIIYLIGKALFSKTVGLLAAFLISFDGLSFAQSRIATRDALLVFLVTTSLYLILRNHRFFSALLAGFALAAKWTSLPLLPLLVFTSHRSTKGKRRSLLRHILLVIAIPPLSYLAAYLPYFASGFTLTDFIILQKTMFTHLFAHGFRLTTAHPLNAPWWLWPLGLKPLPYYQSGAEQVWAAPNLLVFWLGIVALGCTVRAFVKNRPKSLLLIFTGYLAFYVPWPILHALSGSTKTSYLYYYLPALPFLHLLSAYWLSRGLSQPGIARTAALVTLAMVPLVFFSLYPRLIGL